MDKFEFEKCTNLYAKNLLLTVDNLFKFLF